MQNQTPFLNHKLELENNKRLSLSGVSSLDGFSSQVLNLTINGTKLKVIGQDIKITSYNKSAGTLVADGIFNEFKYAVKSVPLVKKIFK